MTEAEELRARRAREAWLQSRVPSQPAGPLLPRAVEASWRRVASVGLDPGSHPDVPPLAECELERRRTVSALSEFVPRLTELLSPVVALGQLVVVADQEGRVLWRSGGPGVLRSADRLGFVGGSAWTESNVGTNAIGTSLVLGEPVSIRGAEHFVESHTAWGCAAAPIRDPWTDAVLGVIDVSGPSRGMHPAELALVELAARTVAQDMVARHRRDLDRLRARAAPLLARMTGDVLAVDRDGHLAAAIGSRAPDRVSLPRDLAGGSVWLPTLGAAVAEPLGPGWLLRLGGETSGAGQGLLDLSSTEPRLTLRGSAGEWSHSLSPRHAEILLALAVAGPAGRTAAELAEDVFADSSRAGTVRPELSRMRRALGGLLRSNPYRVSEHVRLDLRLPDDRRTLLPTSAAPVVVRLRAAEARVSP